MSEAIEQISVTNQTDLLVANLLDFFRDPKNEDLWPSAARIANTLVRLSRNDGEKLEKRFLFFASRLKNNITNVSIKNFAIECIEAAIKVGVFSNTHSPPSTSSLKVLQKKAQKELSEAILAGHSPDAALHRAVNELVKNRRKLEAFDRLAKMAKSHPLKENLSSIDNKDGHIAKEDIRYHFLRLKRRINTQKNGEGVLFGLLEKAQAFSALRLYRLLGDELFFLCRPLGFLEQSGLTLLVEVPTSAHLHALTYRKLQILRSLKQDPTFQNVRNIRFKVTSGVYGG